jgi:rare lipoprotein A
MARFSLLLPHLAVMGADGFDRSPMGQGYPRMKVKAVSWSVALLLVAATVPGARASVGPQEGIASFYGNNDGFHGGKTANGERYDKNSMTAAHKTAKFGTKMKVTNLSNGKSVVVRINNRGPYIRGRIIDVSVAAARQLGFFSRGITKVRIEPVNAAVSAVEPAAAPVKPAEAPRVALAARVEAAKPAIPPRTVAPAAKAAVASGSPLDLLHFVQPAKPVVAASAAIIPVAMPLPTPKPAR